jgi:hypothetical protein
MEKNREDEQIWVIIYNICIYIYIYIYIYDIYLEMSQGNSLYRYLKQTKMSFVKNREQEGKTDPV